MRSQILPTRLILIGKRAGLAADSLAIAGGTLLAIVAFAAGPGATFLVPGAKLSGNATVATNASAIGGKMVVFGSGSAGSGGSTATPTPTVKPTPTPTPAPAGWPGASNTGYTKAPGYPGSLKTCSGSIQSNTTYSYCNFSSGVAVGSSGSPVTNVTFYGCRFASNNVNFGTVTVYGDNVKFDYSTFEPSAVSTTPVAYTKGYQFGIDTRYPGAITVDHSNFWGWGNAITFEYSTQAKPFVVRNSWFHDARADGGIDHTDAILSNDGGPTHMVFDHNTIVSAGNTNGLALQYDHTPYSNVTVTNNYFSGFGYTVNLGGDGHLSNSVFTDNVFATDIKPTVGPLYGWGGTNNTWRRNKVHYVSGPAVYFDNLHNLGPITAADDGKYWWPNDTMSWTDYAGT